MLLDRLKDSYQVLTIDEERQFEYDSTYYDYGSTSVQRTH